MTLYNLFSTSKGTCITKWDDDFNVAASYIVGDRDCTCPARKPCKHMEMYRQLYGQIDKNTFYDPDTDSYYELNQ